MSTLNKNLEFLTTKMSKLHCGSMQGTIISHTITKLRVLTKSNLSDYGDEI